MLTAFKKITIITVVAIVAVLIASIGYFFCRYIIYPAFFVTPEHALVRIMLTSDKQFSLSTRPDGLLQGKTIHPMTTLVLEIVNQTAQDCDLTIRAQDVDIQDRLLTGQTYGLFASEDDMRIAVCDVETVFSPASIERSK